MKFPRATRLNLWRSEHAGEEPPLGIGERAELAQLRRDNQTLRMEREFLKKAAAYVGNDCQALV